MRLIALLLCLLAAPLRAQDLPALFSVTGVAADDQLNIRAAPSPHAEIIGAIGPWEPGVGVLRLSEDGKWGNVRATGRNGWVAMRHLARVAEDPADTPIPLVCAGVEPFWRLGLYAGGLEYDAPDTGRRDLDLRGQRVAENGWLMDFEEGPTLTRTLIVQRFPCTDTMSETEYGYRALLFTDAPDGASVQGGCCWRDTRF